MNEESSPRNPSPDERVSPSAPENGEDLDAEIREAELAVIRRDERVRRNFAQLKQRTAQVSRARLAFAGGAALLSLLAAMRLLRGRGVPQAVVAAVSSQSPFWRRLGSTVFPAVRGGPSGMLLSLVIPALGNYLALRRERKRLSGEAPAGENRVPPVASAADFDLDRYLGQWYEIARLPTSYEKRCAGDARAQYVPTAAKNVFAIANRCRRHDGRTAVAYGIGRADDRHPSRLKVTFVPRMLRGLPWFWYDYWVLKIDGDYRGALVGTPDRRRLWLLSRTPSMERSAYDSLIVHAQAQGFDTSGLLRIVHGQPGADTS